MSEWISFCIITQLVMAVWTHECLETETIELRPISDDLKLPTACLMDCTMMTYNKKLQIQDQRNIRFTDCTQGKHSLYSKSTYDNTSLFIKWCVQVFCQNTCTYTLMMIIMSLLRKPWRILLVHQPEVHSRRKLSTCLCGVTCGHNSIGTSGGQNKCYCHQSESTQLPHHNRRELWPPV